MNKLWEVWAFLCLVVVTAFVGAWWYGDFSYLELAAAAIILIVWVALTGGIVKRVDALRWKNRSRR